MNKNLLISLLFSFFAAVFSAQSIDPGFGTNGSQLISNLGVFYNASLNPDGKMLLPGYRYDGSDDKAVLLKMNVDGTPDLTFGINGKFEINQYAGPDHFEEFGNVRVLPDGKILLLYYYNFDNNIDPEINGTKVVRLHANGTLDNTFNNTMIFGDSDAWYGFEILPGGKILGFSENSLRRILPDGSVDTSFANNGVRTMTLKLEHLFVNSAGIFLYDYQDSRFIKLANEESLIPTELSTSLQITGDILMHNNHFFLTLYDSFTSKYSLMKIDFNLARDPTFGNNGTTALPDNYYNLQAVQENGSVLCGSTTYDGPANSFTIVMQRLNPDGSPDLTFGTQGEFSYSAPNLYYGDFFYHTGLKKMYVMMEQENSNNTLISRFNIPAEILAVQSAGTSKGVRVLENPVRDILRLSSALKNAAIYNVAGIKTSISFSGSEVSVERLPPGIYLVTGNDAEGQPVTLKMIKK